MKELVLKKCAKCNSLVKVLEDCTCTSCGIMCCGEEMKLVKTNSEEASFEKHIPTYEKTGDNVKITVNHVMEENHYIEWILVKTETINIEKILKPQEEPTLLVPYEKGMLIYSYCNQHGLWKTEVTDD